VISICTASSGKTRSGKLPSSQRLNNLTASLRVCCSAENGFPKMVVRSTFTVLAGKRAARLADGWFSYAVSPEMFAKGLVTIEAAAQEAGRRLERFGTAHLMFTRVGDSYERALDEAAESLSVRYAMNMRPATERYGAIGTPTQVAEKIRAFHAAGVRHLSLDLVGPYERRGEQFERFAAEVRPLIKDLME
jgi:alkanesulfonate monooxygenase SsuD/methylene tetrahydromethanopterin reductase-like flavin-dependent oxidoreductase (luciferase family)